MQPWPPHFHHTVQTFLTAESSRGSTAVPEKPYPVYQHKLSMDEPYSENFSEGEWLFRIFSSIYFTVF